MRARGAVCWKPLVVLLLAATSIGAMRAAAQPLPPGANAALDSSRALRGEPLQISLVTYGPGEDVWERFGHDAIEVQDSVTGRDVVYNWGMFDFQQPHFYVRFLTGDTKYWMQGAYTAEFNADYVAQNRTVRVQHLALTPAERVAMVEFLEWNAEDAHKFYRYDYYRDNCSTRARDAIDRVLQGRLKAVLDTGVTTHTWRGETARTTASDPLVYPGIEVALGRNADRPLSRWAEAFMPERLADALDGLVLRNDEGLRFRLVDRDTVLHISTRVPVPIDPPERLAMSALLGLTIAGIIAFLADSRFQVLRGVLVTLAVVWYTIGGILGTALLLAGTITKHAPYMGQNLSLWQVNPFVFAALLSVPLALARRRATAFARFSAVGVVVLCLIGALLQLVPGLAQHSGVVIAVTLPVNIVLAAAVLRGDRTTTRRASGTATLARAA
jgi:hypothetical protein